MADTEKLTSAHDERLSLGNQVSSNTEDGTRRSCTGQTIVMPTSIASMSDKEIKLMHTKMIRKLDLIIL